MGKMTGGKVLAITVAFFGVIIAVNFFMAYKAISTFPGLEVDNSYVASQVFDKNRKAQENLGWTLAADYTRADQQLTLNFTGKDGQPAALRKLDVLVGRTTEAKDDRRPTFTNQGDVWTGQTELANGLWLLRVEAEAADGTAFSQRIEIYVRD